MKPTRVAIVHGYFLGDSGSAVYVRELARELTHQGHDVTLVCQEQNYREYDFVDSFYELDENNSELSARFERKPAYQGSCRLVRPNLGGELLTYVAGPFPGYDALPFQEASDDQVETYITRNIAALKTVFSRWRPDFVQANHLLMQPFLVAEALPEGVPYVVTIHGSALNFTAKADDRMVPYALTGLDGATAVGALSDTSCGDVIDFARRNGADISGKTIVLPPGVDSDLMRPLSPEECASALKGLSTEIDYNNDEIAIFAGRLLWTKGLHYAVAAMPLILQSHSRYRLIVVGEGPMEHGLRELIDLLDAGKLDRACSLTASDPELRPGEGYGPVIPDLKPGDGQAYIEAARGNIKRRVHFTGHLAHAGLAPLYASADISLALSVFAEAFALVSIEALAAGAIPVVTYQTGLRAAADTVAAGLDDPDLRRLVPGGDLTNSLAETVAAVLERYPTRESGFREELHRLADREYSWRRVAARYLELAQGEV